MQSPRPFSSYEWLIAWRYLRARRAEGGVSVMTIISLVGITLAVAALIITLAVRTGFRTEFVGTILGANAHVTVFSHAYELENGGVSNALQDFDNIAEKAREVPGVIRAAPLVRGQVMANYGAQNAAGDVYGIRAEDLATLPSIADAEQAYGDLSRFEDGIAIGSVLARSLGVTVGDVVRLINPNGVTTVLGSSPRISNYEVVYVFTAGRYDIDQVRIYMPFSEAQLYFNRDGVADQIEVMVDDPERIQDKLPAFLDIAGPLTRVWTWHDSAGAFLQALDVEDTVMFVLMSVLVLIAAMNIISGLVMLVKNKGRDIGILRTIGFSEGSILRVFFICGSAIGVAGTVVGVALGCAFAIWIDPIFSFVNYVAGGGVWDPSVRLISALPARLEGADVLSAVILSLGLSFVVTIFPARRAARMNPVEALRYE